MKSRIHSVLILFPLLFLQYGYGSHPENFTGYGDVEYHIHDRNDQNHNKEVLLDTLRKIEKSLEERPENPDESGFSDLDTEEWKRYKLFNRKIVSGSKAEYLEKSKSYIKDSTQILIIKLKALETLDHSGLLEQDIRKNRDYYLDLIEEFRNSDLDPKYYLYFENKIRKINNKTISARYHTSLFFNIVGFLSLGVFGFTAYRRQRKKTGRKIDFLSAQERKVVHLILLGKSNKEIASELFISLSTVKTHITNSYGKLEVSNRKELVRKYCNKQGLAPISTP
ncbi:response regulator transcription factor [Sinomicrobium weinanense]|uniref:Helix-turn-helix transcriptional regulator n=1 Tax=Sinomicrobium weinanense TaxID=2842200 RepID=A0A926Q372_9FLAO|nr:helix-turn-helix transcriptional regulator [Sinomicrobium weinanense]MBC9796614.1 helix-turn-helix transcriptional regulator [Sinomicrobium weinanense]MBU3123862.1 helix-turn-helix transcriptional regulator [Sinomicrobium weinanense]